MKIIINGVVIVVSGGRYNPAAQDGLPQSDGAARLP